jgi:conjugal transfer/entry exclusion protein
MKPTSNLKSRQLAYLNSQIAQLQANLSDMENHLRVTMVHAEYIRKLGVLHGSLYVYNDFCTVRI